MDEALLAVHDPGVVDAEVRILDDLTARGQGEDDGEGRRGDDVRVAEGLRGGLVAVDRIRVVDGVGELTDLLPPDLEGAGRRGKPPPKTTIGPPGRRATPRPPPPG